MCHVSQRRTQPLHPSPAPAWRSDGARDGDRRPAVDVILAALERNGPTTSGSIDAPLEVATPGAMIGFATEADGRAALVRAGRDL